MRTPFLQYLYLRKPVMTVIAVCALAVLPWIGMGGFSTKGEPREAAVAISMLESGNWVLPEVYANEFAYKPPMAHWLMAAFSLPQGYVSEFTSRLPSAISYMLLVGMTLLFFGRRVRFHESFISALLLLTCIEIHRAGATARVDMLLTCLTVISLYTLYHWEDRRELEGLPLSIPLLLGAAVLTKGPVGSVLPLLVFAVYLVSLGKYPLKTVLKTVLYAGVSSVFLPVLWYVAAWREGGDSFLNVVIAENFGRFFHITPANTGYDLGHEQGAWYNILTLVAGLMPWTLLIAFSLPALRLPGRPAIRGLIPRIREAFRSMDKVKQFSLIALICIIVFYSIPSSKRSVYLMPAYPFITIFASQYILHIARHMRRATMAFAGLLVTITVAFLAIALLTATKTIDLTAIAAPLTAGREAVDTISAINTALSRPDSLTWLIMLVLLAASLTVIYQMRRKINLKILYSVIFIVFAVNLLIDGVIMRAIRNQTSPRPFAERIMTEYPLTKDNVYVMNNLKEYTNLYGLNFYMHNIFHNFEKDHPREGYLLAAEDDIKKIIALHPAYTFTLLTTSTQKSPDIHQKIHLLSVTTTVVDRSATAPPEVSLLHIHNM
ncbi:MAG: glycosyltransferase family 39 protein [Tannerellaceae bacterium]|jgi:4-amino-4-deoxy-L-arabinose transferase-like glycosyltransferase|nr:glycosyltransferase family 39 protein [Tannerellaceae bacterium]